MPKHKLDEDESSPNHQDTSGLKTPEQSPKRDESIPSSEVKVSPLGWWFNRLRSSTSPMHCQIAGATPRSKRKFEATCHQKIPSFKTGEEGPVSPETGLPITIETPEGKERLKRIHSVGPLHFYGSSTPKGKIGSAIRQTLEEHAEPIAGSVPTPANLHKIIEVELTATKIVEIKNTRRTPDQAHVMASGEKGVPKVSATEIKKSILTPKNLSEILTRSDLPQSLQEEISKSIQDIRLEWLHLAAHSFLGNEAQIPENLVAGTAECNTQMMIAEMLVKIWLSHHPDKKIKLMIDAELFPDTHFAKKITYTILPDGEKPYIFEFNATSSFKPSRGQAMAAKIWSTMVSEKENILPRKLFPETDSPDPKPKGPA